MSKKNRRKTLVPKKEGLVRKGEFDFAESKIYIMLTIIMFHIVPLIFVMLGKNGQEILRMSFLMMLNPIFVAITGLIYGIKKGFNFKFPIIMGFLAAISVPMYYTFETSEYMMQTTIIMAIVYIIFSVVSAAIGGFVKKMMNL